MITALIVDNEPLARAHLRRQLETQGVTVAGEAENGPRALQMAEELRPDVITIEVQSSGQTDMDMAAALLHLHQPPLMIFVAGHSRHAAIAFELDALDYLVRPIAPERLAKTIVRARARLAARRHLRLAADAPLRMLPVRGDYAVRLVKVEEILFATTRDKRVLACTTNSEYCTRHTLTQLEQLLPANLFLRVHDSWLINLEHIRDLLFLGNHSYMVRLDNNQQVPVGRTRYAELQRRLGLHFDLPGAHSGERHTA